MADRPISQRGNAELADPHRLALQVGTVSFATSNLYTRAVLPPAIPGSWSGAGLACSLPRLWPPWLPTYPRYSRID
jgi:hypothetical protein